MKEIEAMQVVHSSPGRVRLKLSADSSEPNLDAFLINGVERVIFNKVTRTVLLIYDDTIPPESLLSRIEEKVPPVVILRKEPRPRETRAESRVSQEVIRQAHEMNARVSEVTDGAISGVALFPLSLIVVGLLKLILLDDPTVVPWYGFVWWGFNIFRGWHRKDTDRAQKVEESQAVLGETVEQEQVEISRIGKEREAAIAWLEEMVEPQEDTEFPKVDKEKETAIAWLSDDDRAQKAGESQVAPEEKTELPRIDKEGKAAIAWLEEMIKLQEEAELPRMDKERKAAITWLEEMIKPQEETKLPRIDKEGKATTAWLSDDDRAQKAGESQVAPEETVKPQEKTELPRIDKAKEAAIA